MRLRLGDAILRPFGDILRLSADDILRPFGDILRLSDDIRSESDDDAADGIPYGPPPPPPRLDDTLDAARDVGVGSPFPPFVDSPMLEFDGSPILMDAFVGVCAWLLVRKSSHDEGSLLPGTAAAYNEFAHTPIYKDITYLPVPTNCYAPANQTQNYPHHCRRLHYLSYCRCRSAAVALVKIRWTH